jgi:uncharacterized repeat protein (TIGR03803 family)
MPVTSLLAARIAALGLIAAAAVPQAHADILYEFSSSAGNTGHNPTSGPASDGKGGLYGTTAEGGAYGAGTIYHLVPPAPGQTAWTQTVLYTFGADKTTTGAAPFGTPLVGPGGVLYGTTQRGGTYEVGTVYALKPPSGTATSWTETLLHSFSRSEGTYPTGRLAADASGALYGGLEDGGLSRNCTNGCGAVFKLAPPGQGQTQWTETSAYQFAGGADGSSPDANVLVDSTGALYGVAFNTLPGYGSVFKLVPPSAGQTQWTKITLYTFSGPDGAYPQGALIMDPAGALYGTTFQGGVDFVPDGGYGTVFKLAPPAAGQSAWTETVLSAFPNAVATGTNPYQGVVMDRAGNLLGTMGYGGNQCTFGESGLVFELTPPTAGQTQWNEHIPQFPLCAFGETPIGTLLIAPSGFVYGAINGYGPRGGGDIYRFHE